MGDNVDFIPLRNLSVRITKGTTPTRGESFVSRGINYVKSEAIAPSGTIDSSKFAYIDEATHNALARSQLCVGNVLFSMAGVYLGKTAVVKPEHVPANTNQAVGIITIDEAKADSRFIHYSIQSPSCRAWIMNSAAQSAQPNFNLKEIGDLPIPSFELEEQRAIAHILGTLDDKIELNRRRNQTLEAMARALFKDWFVDFGPVRAKMEGREPYLPADLWRLFPNRLDDEGKPEGWETKRISDYLSLAYGKSLPAGKRHTGGVPVYGSGGITGFHSEALVNEPAVIVGRKGTVGSLYWEDRPCFPIDTVFFVQPEAPLPFCYCLLESLPLRDMNTDAAVPGLNRENVYRLEVAAPPTVLIATFAETASRFRESIAAVSGESETLAQLRDTLLPKLISGELRIADVEKFLEGVGL